MKKNYKNILFLIIILALFLGGSLAVIAAADPLSRMSRAASQAGLETQEATPQSIIFNIVIYLLGFVGFIFLIMIIAAGAQWLTSGGSEDKIRHAQDRLKSAIIGLIIVVAAYAITTFVAQVMIKSTCTGYYCYPTGAPSPCGNMQNEYDCTHIPGGYCYWLDGRCQQ